MVGTTTGAVVTVTVTVSDETTADGFSVHHPDATTVKAVSFDTTCGIKGNVPADVVTKAPEFAIGPVAWYLRFSVHPVSVVAPIVK